MASDDPTLAASVPSRLGHPIYFDREDHRGASLELSGGDLNPHSLELWNKALGLREWDAAIDVGTNYGEMIAGAEFADRTRIMAFEPNPAVLPYLERTLDAYPREVELVRRAVSDEVSAGIEFARDVTWSGKSTLIMGERDDTRDDELATDLVEVTTLDAELQDSGLTSACIKIDVEGAEESVLRGASGLLERLREWAVMLEILHMNTRQVAELVRNNFVYLLDSRSRSLVRVMSTNPEVLADLLGSGWLYRQDALLVSSPELVA